MNIWPFSSKTCHPRGVPGADAFEHVLMSALKSYSVIWDCHVVGAEWSGWSGFNMTQMVPDDPMGQVTESFGPQLSQNAWCFVQMFLVEKLKPTRLFAGPCPWCAPAAVRSVGEVLSIGRMSFNMFCVEVIKDHRKWSKIINNHHSLFFVTSRNYFVFHLSLQQNQVLSKVLCRAWEPRWLLPGETIVADEAVMCSIVATIVYTRVHVWFGSAIHCVSVARSQKSGAWCRFCIRPRARILCSRDLKTADCCAFMLILLPTNDADVDVDAYFPLFSIIFDCFPQAKSTETLQLASEVLLEDREIENVGQGRPDFIWSYTSDGLTIIHQDFKQHVLISWCLLMFVDVCWCLLMFVVCVCSFLLKVSQKNIQVFLFEAGGMSRWQDRFKEPLSSWHWTAGRGRPSAQWWMGWKQVV